MENVERVRYKLYDYSLYIPIHTKGWSKKARKNRTLVRKKGINTKCDTFGEKVVRKRLLMRLISIYRRMPSFSLKSLTKFEVMKGKKIKGKAKIVG